jgi:hypothetical protein
VLVRDVLEGKADRKGGKGGKVNEGADVEEEGVELVPGDGKTSEAAVGAFAS